jgi:transposase
MKPVLNSIDKLFVRHDTLFFDDDKGRVQMVIPLPYREALIKSLHDSPFAGHMGVAKTTQRVQRFYFWPGMVKDIKRYVAKCEICNRGKPSRKMVVAAKAVLFHEVFDTLALDLVGPLPRTVHGNVEYRYLLTVQCCLSKFLFAIPLADTTAKTICDELFRRVFSFAGIPRRVILDNGPQLVAQEFREYMSVLGVQLTYTSTYTPSSNPVERAHRTLKQTLTMFVQDHAERWYEFLPSVLLSLNTAVHQAVQDSPFYLFYGRDFLPPSDRALQKQVTGWMDNPEPHNILASSLVLAREVAKHHLENMSQHRQEKANSSRRMTELQPGMRCYLEASAPKVGKFQNAFHGPYRLIKWTSPQNVMIRDVQDPLKPSIIVHASRVKAEPGAGKEILLPSFRNIATQTHKDHKGTNQPAQATQTEDSVTHSTTTATKDVQRDAHDTTRVHSQQPRHQYNLRPRISKQ